MFRDKWRSECTLIHIYGLLHHRQRAGEEEYIHMSLRSHIRRVSRTAYDFLKLLPKSQVLSSIERKSRIIRDRPLKIDLIISPDRGIDLSTYAWVTCGESREKSAKGLFDMMELWDRFNQAEQTSIEMTVNSSRHYCGSWYILFWFRLCLFWYLEIQCRVGITPRQSPLFASLGQWKSCRDLESF